MRRAAFVVMFLSVATPAFPQGDASATARDHGPQSIYYDSVLVAGPKESKRTVFFFWSAVDESSLSEFRTRVAPAMAAKNLQSTIVVSQVFDARHHDVIGPGALLLCADDYRRYAGNVLKYLQGASDVAKVYQRKSASGAIFYMNPAISALADQRSIDLGACERNPHFYVRQTRAASKTKQIFARFGHRQLPFYVLEGVAYDPGDPRIASVLRPAR